MKQIIVETCGECPACRDNGIEFYCLYNSIELKVFDVIPDDCPLSDLPEQITDEQFEKELQKRLYRMRMKSDEIGLTQQNYDWIKDQLLKGGKG